MDPRLGGALFGVAIMVGVGLAWLLGTFVLCAVLFMMIKGKYPLVARTSERLCLLYSGIWGLVLAAWFLFTTFVLMTYVFHTPIRLLDWTNRSGLLIDAANFAFDIAAAVYATSAFLRRASGRFSMTFLHPATILASIVLVTFLFDLVRYDVRSLADLDPSQVWHWFSLEHIRVYVDLVRAILSAPDQAGTILLAHISAIISASEGNMFRLTTLLGYVLFLMTGWRLLKALFGKQEPQKIRLISGSARSDHHDQLSTSRRQIALTAGIAIAGALTAWVIRSLGVEGWWLVLGVAGMIACLIACIALAFQVLALTIIFAAFTSGIEESEWKSAHASAA